MLLDECLTRYTAQVSRRAVKPHFAFTLKDAANDVRCAHCGKVLCGCDDHRWKGSAPKGAA